MRSPTVPPRGHGHPLESDTGGIRLTIEGGAPVEHFGQLIGERVELRRLGDEVGLAVELEQDRFPGGNMAGDHRALGGDAARPLGRGGQTLLAEEFDGSLHVARRGLQGRLAVHHARARLLAQFLYL